MSASGRDLREHLVNRVLPSQRLQGEPFAAVGLMQTFHANTEIVSEGSRADRIYKVITGGLRTVRFMEDGRRQIGSFYLAGEIFGLGARETHAFAAETIGSTSLVSVRRDQLDAAPASMADSLWQMMMLELERAQDHFVTLGRRTAVERVASFLLDMSARTGDRDVIDLPMCRQDIADFLGLTIETVSRTMTLLERNGLLRLRSARQIVLTDRPALLRLEG